MSVLWILLVGVVIVIGGILLFRLHAFLVLILAAFVVSALTPDHALVQFGVDRADLKVLDVDTARETFLVRADRDAVPLGARLLVLEADKASGEFAEVATLEVASYEKPEDALGDAYAVAKRALAAHSMAAATKRSILSRARIISKTLETSRPNRRLSESITPSRLAICPRASPSFNCSTPDACGPQPC